MGNRKRIVLLVPLSAVIAVWSIPGSSVGSVRGDSRIGSHRDSITWDGLQRTYLIHVPPSWNASLRMPLVIALHGGNGTGEDMVRLTRGGFDALADREGFIVVYPEGLSHSGPIRTRWNDGRDEQFSKADDVGFLSALIDQFGQTLNIDRSRVYATGISNGAQMAMRLARELSDKIAAVAPVAYAMPAKLASAPVSTRPISVLVMTGTKDRSVPWEGGETPDPTGERRLGRVLSVPRTCDVLVSHNQCSCPPMVTSAPDGAAGVGTRVRQERWVNCKDGTEVLLYAIEGGGHTWPVSVDASQVIWGFFKRHAR